MFGNLIKAILGGGSGNSMSAAAVSSLLNEKKIFVLDVRSKEEFASGHIKGAKNIPLDVLQKRLVELEGIKEKEFIVNCLSGGRSSNACMILKAAGFVNPINLEGGISAWRAAGLPVVK